MKVNVRRALVFLSFFLLFAFSACRSVSKVVEAGGRLLDGSLFAYKTERRWVSLEEGQLEAREVVFKDKTRGLVFSSAEIPYIVFYAAPPDERGFFDIISIHFLAGNYGGWQEFTAEAEGRGRLRVLGGSNASFSVSGNVKVHAITGGAIRREETRLSGEKALQTLRARRERVDYLVAWMRGDGAGAGFSASMPPAPVSYENKTAAARQKDFFAAQDAFEKHWRTLFFKRKSAVALPAELETLKQEGALEDDWDEAASWIYLDYIWDDLGAVLNREFILFAR